MGTLAHAAKDDAKAHFQKGTTAFSLGNYAEAAGEYEKAFALKPDPALLFNAAQSHRLAGNKQRALTLYQNYLRVFGDRVANADDVQRQILKIKAELEEERVAAEAAAKAKEQPAAPAPAPVVTPAPAAAVAAPAPAEAPVYKRKWFWPVVVGSVVVVGVGVGLGVGLGTASHAPSPSLGKVDVGLGVQ
jgi:tetratricopeptide (TPR) repeat protein